MYPVLQNEQCLFSQGTLLQLRGRLNVIRWRVKPIDGQPDSKYLAVIPRRKGKQGVCSADLRSRCH